MIVDDNKLNIVCWKFVAVNGMLFCDVISLFLLIVLLS